MRIEALDRGHQPLAPQDLVTTRDATREVVVDIEHDRIAVGDEGIERQHLRWDGAGRDRELQPLQHFDRPARPHAPMAEQSALEAQCHFAIAGAHHHRRHEISDDVIVVAGVERDAILGMGLGNADRDIERAIAVERRHLDRHDVVDGGEPRPEGTRQRDAAHRRLQVEANQRHLLGDGRAMLDQLVLAGTFQRRQRQQHGVIAQRPRGARFLDGLGRLADRARDHHQRTVGPLTRGLDGELENRAIEPDIADGELGRMHADRQAARTGIDIVAADRALRLLVELAVGRRTRQREGWRPPRRARRAAARQRPPRHARETARARTAP